MSRNIDRLGKAGVALATVGAIVQQSLFNVDAGERAIIFDQFQGVRNTIFSEGSHFRIPLVQRPIYFNVKSQPRNINTITGSKDMQTVNITLRLLYRPNVLELPKIYKTIGKDYDERVLPSIGNEVLKAIVAQFDASELITQREIVSQKVRKALIERANEFNILLDDISITHLTFGKDFTQAVELKQVAQQDAERAKFVVEKAEQEKLANVIRAEGDSIAAELISKAISQAGDAFVELRRIDAVKEIAQTLSQSNNVKYIPGNQNTLLQIQ